LGNGLPPTVWRKKREIICHYDEIANTYDSLYRDEQDLKIENALRHVNFNGSDSILDAGCGTGFLFEHVHRHVGHLVGVDLSIGLLRVALAHVKQSGMKTVSLVRADVGYLPFKGRVFDKVFALTLIQDFAGSSVTLIKMMRTAKDESTFVITGLKKVFSEAIFKKVLTEAGLEPNILLTSEQVKDIIVVCQKHRKAKDK
jgi:ubiquinone/menaquinone biosynthesis C-methylase UbiE